MFVTDDIVNNVALITVFLPAAEYKQLQIRAIRAKNYGLQIPWRNNGFYTINA